ncbi:PREDICTED: uncharacterized protein LOC108770525 [Trachymyrmex cornetzi]|uniref:uncharacterized protein LOC108770525 n=1 Tax=Trachymyrmex cornetzi TaxID=471704 RepID=UPI00084F56C4|nr:PREDICTED: uncharacterized protein LOC108770525 [Trachymyrmex cornetzi]
MREMLYPVAALRASASPSPSSSGFVPAQPVNHIRLPKLDLPKFSGKYDEWYPFFDSFNSLIHINASLSDVQKLQYLRASLTGDAAKIISALEISDPNYQVAWAILKERYDNRREIVQSHIKAIFELPSMAKENITELRQIVDGATRHIHALQVLKRPTTQWDDLLVYILSSKLDALTSREWQLSLTGTALPTLKQFTDFVTHRCITLETSSKNKIVNARAQSQSNTKQQSCVAFVKAKCVFCKGKHLVYHCESFLALPVSRRIAEARKRKLCANCLRPADHAANKCPSGSCKICRLKHNTLLHLTVASAKSDDSQSYDRVTTEPAAADTAPAVVSSSVASSKRGGVMLSTAVAFVQDDEGHCINNTTTRSFEAAELILHSRANSFSIAVDCIVTERVTGQIQPSASCPTLQKTRFGWILAGRSCATSGLSTGVHSFHTSITNSQLHEQLTKFWEIENAAAASDPRTAEEIQCEQHFIKNVSRTEQGRFVVKLPFAEPAPHAFVSSRSIALKRFKATERRFNRDSDLKEQYFKFMGEYIALGHMRQVGEGEDEDSESFYLPHHCIFKSPASNKFRVVFDASAKDAAGVALNDILMVGPTVQQDLFTILLRFRTFRYALSADIVKMYRQIQVHLSQTRYQRILWREEFTSNIVAYELLTLTYGTSPASFLATRCLMWLSEHEAVEWPRGAACVGRDFYVDDMLTGADTFNEAVAIRDETIKVLRAGAFELGKWASNHSGLLKGIKNQNENPVVIQDAAESSVLGIHWVHSRDTFRFLYSPDGDSAAVSKRNILSEISRLFDPLGLLGPVIVRTKLILQELWQLGAHWDESVPQELHTRWTAIKSQLADINHLDIPRCVKYAADSGLVQIHGFCDASQRAYGVCVYVRTKLEDNTYRVELLCSKSRVAPLKALSLPRLELSAALLLARLMHKIQSAFDVTGIRKYMWADSTIVLNWISSPSRRWSVFVAHRIGEIQELTEVASWRHIRLEDNPADCLSRGLSPHDVTESTMWWHGPAFLQHDEELWPNSDFACSPHNLPEQRKCVATVTVSDSSIVNELLNRHSSLDKTYRVIAYCLRFFKARHPHEPGKFITPREKQFAVQIACTSVQKQAFLNTGPLGRDAQLAQRAVYWPCLPLSPRRG